MHDDKSASDYNLEGGSTLHLVNPGSTLPWVQTRNFFFFFFFTLFTCPRRSLSLESDYNLEGGSTFHLVRF